MAAPRKTNAATRYEQVPAREPENEPEDDRDYLCGVGNYRPCWMQRFATSRYFALVFGVLGIFQGAYRTYLVGTLSTVEKRFSMSGHMSSFIMIADDISPVMGTVVLMLCLRRTSKPNWVAGGMLLSVVGAVSSVLPYAVYGKGTHLLGNTGQPGNALRTQFCGDGNVDAVNCGNRKEDLGSLGPLIFLFMGNFFNGLGGTAYYVIGTTYMDDNVKKKNSALYFGSLYAFRLMGPVVGFFLSSLCLSYPEDLNDKPDMRVEDPRWIGAWWVGYLVIGTGILLSLLPMFFFPKKIRPKAAANKVDIAGQEDKGFKADVKETLQALNRLFRNPVYVLRTFASISAYIALAGYYISFPKYTEHQFSQTASRASLFAGPTYIVSNVIGTILGAIFVHKVKPSPRVVAALNVIVTVVSVGGIVALMLISCGSIHYPVVRNAEERLTIENSCTADCDCSTSIHHPVCDPNTDTQYFSACFAGCLPEAPNQTEFRDCRCLQSEPGESQFSIGLVQNGKCEQDCFDAMMAFAGVVFFMQVVLSTSHVGSTLLFLRAIEPKDKSVALTMNSFIMNMFAFIPYPLIYGAVIDASCLVWEDRCGDRGACWIYDLQKLRYLIHGVTTVLLVISAVFQCGVVYYSKIIKNFYDEGETDPPDALAGAPDNSKEGPEIHELDVQLPEPARQRKTSTESWEFQNFNKMVNVTDSL
ncbi:hypothetical protein HPB47_021757 [Ixodes persulcatus]|uniref:Uncharacterized protein n=1 Tax=Ixodes persulcatus TaxID=34615 RepID=A0AC60QBY9_IXOPE|nr:hypothetical protein HPB47_021757 [Ixodes persulcatus]